MIGLKIFSESGHIILEQPLDGEKEIIVIGRDADTDMVIEDSYISRRHAELYSAENKLYIKDLGSKFGTAVNGNRLNPNDTRQIFLSDKIVLGEKYCLVLGGAGKIGSTAVSGSKVAIGEAVKQTMDFFEGMLSSLLGRLKPLAEERYLDLTRNVEHFGKIIFKRLKELATIQEMSRRMNEIHDFDQLLKTVLGLALEVSGAERGMIMLYDEEKGRLETIAARGIEEGADQDQLVASRSIAEKAFLQNEIVVISDAMGDPKYREEASVIANRILSAIVAPLLIRGEVVGVLYLDNRFVDHCFSDRNMDFIKTFAAQAAFTLYNARLYNQAVTDGLTGLYNNKFFRQRLGEEFRRASRAKSPLSLLMLDVDHFKKFNDTHGHQVGDLVLKTVAKVMKATARISDIPARYGGEEFTVILPGSDEDGAMVFAERLRESIQAAEISHNENKLSVTASLGVATFSENCGDPEELIRRADSALYGAKHAGRNRSGCWKPAESK